MKYIVLDFHPLVLFFILRVWYLYLPDFFSDYGLFYKS